MRQDGEKRGPSMDAAMHLVRERDDTNRPVFSGADVELADWGPINYHCAECGTLLIRDAGEVLRDIIVMCHVCLSLNEATDGYVPLPRNRLSVSSRPCAQKEHARTHQDNHRSAT